MNTKIINQIVVKIFSNLENNENKFTMFHKKEIYANGNIKEKGYYHKRWLL